MNILGIVGDHPCQLSPGLSELSLSDKFQVLLVGDHHWVGLAGDHPEDGQGDHSWQMSPGPIFVSKV